MKRLIKSFLVILSISASVLPWIVFSKFYGNQYHLIASVVWLCLTILAVVVNRQKRFRLLFLLAIVAFLPTLYISTMFLNFLFQGFKP